MVLDARWTDLATAPPGPRGRPSPLAGRPPTAHPSLCPAEPDSDPSPRLSSLSGSRASKAFLSHWLFQRSPLRRSRFVESTPGRTLALAGSRAPIGVRLRHRPRVPTSWFHTTSPACSSSILSALLQRLTTLGFIVVSPSCLGSPRCVFCPSKLSLRQWPSSLGRRHRCVAAALLSSALAGSRLLPGCHLP